MNLCRTPPLSLKFVSGDPGNIPVHAWCGKRRSPKVQPSTRPGIEPGTSWLAVRDLTNCANLAHTIYCFLAEVILKVMQSKLLKRHKILSNSVVHTLVGTHPIIYFFWRGCAAEALKTLVTLFLTRKSSFLSLAFQTK